MTSIAVGTLALVLVLGTVAPLFADDVSVKGYFRRDGTYVMRTFPNTFDWGRHQFRKACGRKHADLSRLPHRRTSDV
jgi:hypothetical protein